MGLWKPTRPSRTNTPKRYPFHYKGLGCKSRKSRDTWSNRQIWAWSAECSNCHRIALISYASKVMLKILQARIQQYANCDFQMFKLELEKAEEPEIKMPTSAGSSKKKKSSRKISALLTTQKSLTVWITTNCGKFLEVGIPDHVTCLLRNLYAGQEAS